MSTTKNGTLEKTIPLTGSDLKPDLVILDKDSKQAIIVDISCPFDNKYEALQESRQLKINKYTPLAQTLQNQGYSTYCDAIIVGSLGSWDPMNELCLNQLSIPETKRKVMKQRIVADVIRWSRDIYVEHVSGHRQYCENVTLPPLKNRPNNHH